MVRSWQLRSCSRSGGGGHARASLPLQCRPTHLDHFTIQAIFSVVHCDAAMMRSPSFSLSMSSTTTRISPFRTACRASSMLSSVTSTTFPLIFALAEVEGAGMVGADVDASAMLERLLKLCREAESSSQLALLLRLRLISVLVQQAPGSVAADRNARFVFYSAIQSHHDKDEAQLQL